MEWEVRDLDSGICEPFWGEVGNAHALCVSSEVLQWVPIAAFSVVSVWRGGTDVMGMQCWHLVDTAIERRRMCVNPFLLQNTG